MDLAPHRQTVARALSALEASIKRLVDALAHRDAWLIVDGARNDRDARTQVCTAYSTIDYATEDEVGSSIVCLGVVGGNADLIKRAEAVNAAKAAFKAVCAPLQKIRTRVPVKENGGGTKAIPVIRVVLRGIQRSDVNLLAAYRKIPILDAPPLSITYTRARTRAVYRKSIEEIYNLLINMEGPLASADRAQLATLGKEDKYLAIVRPHYDNVRANIVYARLDTRGRGRVQLAAELPLLYSTGRHHTIPEVAFPIPVEDESELPRRKRQSELEPKPFLQTIAAYRYTQKTKN
jgi:hypothetical protein